MRDRGRICAIGERKCSTGDDTLTGEAGDDTLDGGVGVDTAVFSGDMAEYVVTTTRTA